MDGRNVRPRALAFFILIARLLHRQVGRLGVPQASDLAWEMK